MGQFKDTAGEQWHVGLNTNTLKAVREQLDLDLVQLDERTFTRLVTDPITLVDVLWLVCRKQAAERQLDDEQFAERVASGEAIEEATQALVEALLDFFPPGRRRVLQAALTKYHQLEAQITQTAEQQIEQLSVKEIQQAHRAAAAATMQRVAGS